MDSKIRPTGKFKGGFFVIIGGVVLGLLTLALVQFGVLDLLKGEEKAASIPESRQSINVDASKIPPSQVKAPTRTTDDPPATIGIWTWQTQIGLIDAVGGTGKSGDYPDSCLSQAGIRNTRLVVMNDTSEQAKAISAGAMQIGTTTGDQSAVDLAGLNTLLRRNGAKAFFSTGYSNGEDTALGPESLKKNPQNARGIVVVTAVPYCDWNIWVNWATDNKIEVNSDESVWDENAINFVNAVDHIEAAQKYVQNAKVSLRDKKTGQMVEKEIEAVGTWTPGDADAVEGRPFVNYKGSKERLTHIISTREYNYMMPNIIFAQEKFINEHKEYLETLTACILRSNDKIRQDPEYLKTRVAPLASLVFNVPNRGPKFWSTFFNGTEINGVPLGGSRVNNLAEVRHLFGLHDGTPIEQSVFGITYTDHAKRVRALMPDKLPSITPVSEVVDLRIIEGITQKGEVSGTTAYTSQFESSNKGSTFVSTNYSIVFDTGSSVVKPTQQNLSALQEILSVMVRMGNTKVLVEGHTDNIGDVGKNLALSQQRAQAVWNYLKQMDRSGIVSESRLAGIEGYGSYRALADNTTEQGRAQNRRVTIVLK